MISKITNVSFKNNTSELKTDAENTEVQPVTNMLEQDTKDVVTGVLRSRREDSKNLVGALKKVNEWVSD